ncbi:hypothetical protein ACA910_021548 [Epithemia clementina (nom. ined.)]
MFEISSSSSSSCSPVTLNTISSVSDSSFNNKNYNTLVPPSRGLRRLQTQEQLQHQHQQQPRQQQSPQFSSTSSSPIGESPTSYSTVPQSNPKIENSNKRLSKTYTMELRIPSSAQPTIVINNHRPRRMITGGEEQELLDDDVVTTTQPSPSNEGTPKNKLQQRQQLPLQLGREELHNIPILCESSSTSDSQSSNSRGRTRSRPQATERRKQYRRPVSKMSFTPRGEGEDQSHCSGSTTGSNERTTTSKQEEYSSSHQSSTIVELNPYSKVRQPESLRDEEVPIEGAESATDSILRTSQIQQQDNLRLSNKSNHGVGGDADHGVGGDANHHHNNNSQYHRPVDKTVKDGSPTQKSTTTTNSKWESPTSVAVESLGVSPAWLRGRKLDDPALQLFSVNTSRQSDPDCGITTAIEETISAQQQQQTPPKQPSSPRQQRAREPKHATVSWADGVPLFPTTTTSSTTPHYSLHQDAIVIFKDDVQEMHSSHILAYASPVLAKKLKRVGGGKYTLDISNGTIDEWHVLKPFLQPHSVQKASVTSQNLVTLLPWFHQLRLDILLNECDALLSTLTFATSNPSKQDWNDLVLLAHICSLANLPATWQTSLETLQIYLDQYPLVLCHQKTSLDSIMALLRECPVALEFLWPTLKMYLPEDMLQEYHNDTTAAVTLVDNPLFPYLLRERVEKHFTVRQQQEKREKERERLRKWHQRKKALEMAGQELEEMQKYNAFLAQESGSFVEPSWMQPDPDLVIPDSDELSEVGNRTTAENSVRGGGVEQQHQQQHKDHVRQNDTFLQAARDTTWVDFAAWWRSWSSSKAGAVCNRETEKFCKEHCQRREPSPEQVPQRTAWLEAVLRNLKRPSLFQPIANNTNNIDLSNSSDDNNNSPIMQAQQQLVQQQGHHAANAEDLYHATLLSESPSRSVDSRKFAC